MTRIAYRAPGAANLHPADAALALPARLHSFPLQRAVVHEVADGPLRQAREGLVRTTGQQLGIRQLREIYQFDPASGGPAAGAAAPTRTPSSRP